MLLKTIYKWMDKQKFLPPNSTDAFLLFTRQNKIDVSKSHFFDIYKNATRIQTIKTGGVYTRSNELVDVIVQRSFFGVNLNNTIEIDEKSVIVNNYKHSRVRVIKSRTGKISSYKLLDNLSNVYIIYAISCHCVVQYCISNFPINTKIFNTFIDKVSSQIKVNNFGKFLLIDNASFQEIDEHIKENLKGRNITITRTPPMGCLFNPIEEFFSYFYYNLSQELFIELIHK